MYWKNGRHDGEKQPHEAESFGLMGRDEDGGCDDICSMTLVFHSARASMLSGSDVAGCIGAAGVGVEVVRAIGGGQRRTQLFRSSDDASDRRFQMEVAADWVGKHRGCRLGEVAIQLSFSLVAGEDLGVGEVVGDDHALGVGEAILDGVGTGAIGEDGIVKNFRAGRVPG